jgi:16S rRNA (cytidine1402-2'-O)-methyltransferase
MDPLPDGTGAPRDPGQPGCLILVATPIGNLGDVSARAAETLAAADVVAAEDTRRTRVLLDHLGIGKPMVSYHDHNERSRAAGLLDRVAAGETVVLVSDAGTPGLADPGFVIVREAIERGLPVGAVPGASALLHALVLSGLPMDRFTFEGFLPRKAGARQSRIAELADEPRTMVLYVAPHRAVEELTALAAALGDRPAALARELTKLHEQVVRGTLSELAEQAGTLRGEMTLVVAGKPADATAPDAVQLAARVRELIATGVDRKEALTAVAKAAGVPRREVYQAVLDAGAADSDDSPG